MGSQTTLLTCLVLVFLLFSFTEAKDFLVGGKEFSWMIPSSYDEFNRWAEKTRFQIGDSLVMKYDAKADSVLEVNKADYKSCNKANPIKSFNDGTTKIQLDRSGPFYFISGAEGHCQKGQKLVVEVLSTKHSRHSVAPAPAPMGANKAPAPAPANGGHNLRVESFSGLAMLFGSAVVGFAFH